MAIKFVDQEGKEFDEWGYTNLSGETESVAVDKTYCSITDKYESYLIIKDNVGGAVRIYVKDVPKLVKAMEEAIASIKEE